MAFPPLRPMRFGRTELAVAMTCVGLLAVAAIPYYLDLGAARRRTEVRALGAHIAAAADLGNSLWQGSGRRARIDVAGAPVNIVNGYPAAMDLARLLDDDGYTPFRFENGFWRHRDQALARDCGVNYRPPVAPDAEPHIELHLAGC